ncbi:hypothetical protein N9K75_01810 [bacterium]|nr:hypothetical protein [bacterium]
MSSPSTTSSAMGNDVPQPDGEKKQMRLVDVKVVDQQTALQLLVTFVNLAQSRGVFKMDESAKIFECIKMFESGN